MESEAQASTAFWCENNLWGNMKCLIVGGYKERFRQDKESCLWEPAAMNRKIICGGLWRASLWVVIRNGLDRIREVVFGNQQLWTGCPNSLLWCYLISHLVACLLSVWFSANRKKKHKAKEEIFGNNGKEYSILGFLKINFTIVRKIRPLKLILFWSKAVY